MLSHIIGFIHGSPSHHYDHIASLCLFLHIPLVVTEETLMEHLQAVYPSLVVYHYNYLEVAHVIVSRYSIILSCHPRPDIKNIFSFVEHSTGKRITSFFIPHGNSDKGYASPLMEGLAYEQLVGIYGQKMRDFMHEKGVLRHLFGSVKLGNYREQVYVRLKNHFQTLLPQINTSQKTILYAPTWEDAEQSGSLFKAIDTLIEKKPPHVTLIVKPHPNTFQTHAGRLEQIAGAIHGRNDIVLIHDFPPIYTILDAANVYLGDMSSIGYDFLTYNRPMFFLNPNRRDPRSDKGLQLTRCGEVIYPENLDVVYDVLDHPQTGLKKARHEMYQYTFGDPVDPKEMLMAFVELAEAFHTQQDR